MIILLMISCEKEGKEQEQEQEQEEEQEEEIRTDSVYRWVTDMQNEHGLLETSRNSNAVSLYDNALAAMLFIKAGDIERAAAIFDFFDARLQTELLETPGGFGQFRDSTGHINGEPHRWLGDNAWLLIALNQFAAIHGESSYIGLRTALENWIRTLQQSDGSLIGGFDGNGDSLPVITEGMLDAFNAVPGYDNFHSGILNFLGQNRWDPATSSLIAWENHPQYEFALDLHSWGYCALQGFPAASLDAADRFMTQQTLTHNNQSIEGYCFDEDRDAVWLEGTAQMLVAYQKAGYSPKIESLFSELEKALIFENDSLSGLPYASNPGTIYGDAPLWPGGDTLPCISSSVWYLFARMEFDPLERGYEKNIPEDKKFWIRK